MHRLKGWLTLVIAAGLLGATSLRAEIVEEVLVKVNGEIISKTDLEMREAQALRQRPDPLPANLSDAELRRMMDEVTPEIIVSSVDEILLLQRAKELGYTMTEEQFQGVLDNIKKENNIDTEEKFQVALKQEGMTLNDLRKALERQMLVGRVQQAEVSSRIDVTEEEEKRYYDEHGNEFAAVPSIMLREILVRVPGDAKGINAARDEEAKAKADVIRARLAKGESFEKVAAEVSDAASKANGGLIGPLKREELAEDLQALLRSMKVGQMSPVFRVGAGYEILKLESSVESTQLTFEQARTAIANRLFAQKQRVELRKYLEKLRSQAIIEWKNQDIRKAFEKGVDEEKAQTS
jgi:peptidyl-prolyl cis-trans isomerase SurA